MVVPRELACFKFRPAGRHTIDADALSSKLQRSRLGKADDSELAGGINRRARKAEVACEGGVLTMAGPLGSPQESGGHNGRDSSDMLWVWRNMRNAWPGTD